MKLVEAVVAFATYAPDGYLAGMAAEAKRQIKWTRWWVDEGYAQSLEVPKPRGENTPSNAEVAL